MVLLSSNICYASNMTFNTWLDNMYRIYFEKLLTKSLSWHIIIVGTDVRPLQLIFLIVHVDNKICGVEIILQLIVVTISVECNLSPRL